MAVLPAMRGEVFAQPFAIGNDVIRELSPARIVRESDVEDEAEKLGARVVGSGQDSSPHARGVGAVIDAIVASEPCDIDSWEPVYGRLAEAQVKWEAAHGRPLSAAG